MCAELAGMGLGITLPKIHIPDINHKRAIINTTANACGSCRHKAGRRLPQRQPAARLVFPIYARIPFNFQVRSDKFSPAAGIELGSGYLSGSLLPCCAVEHF